MKLNFKACLILSLAVGVVGCVGVALLLPSGATRFVAEAGVLLGLLGSVVGLGAKRWALQRAPKTALGVTVGMFFVRVVLCAAGAFWVRGQHQSVPAFVLGFTLMFFILVWVETAFLFSAWRSQPGGAAA